MERFNALGRGALMMLVGGVLLFIALFFNWQNSSDVLGVEVLVPRSGWNGIGVILGLLTIVLLAWLIVRLASVNIPLPVSTAMTAALIATLILIFTVIKILTILGDEPTIWAWVGLALAVVVAVGAFQVVQEAGGIDQLRSEVPAVSSGDSAAAPEARSEPAPPPAATSPETTAAPGTETAAPQTSAPDDAATDTEAPREST